MFVCVTIVLLLLRCGQMIINMESVMFCICVYSLLMFNHLYDFILYAARTQGKGLSPCRFHIIQIFYPFHHRANSIRTVQDKI